MIPVGANLISGEFNIQQRVERWKDKGTEYNKQGYDKKGQLTSWGSRVNSVERASLAG